MIRREDEKLVFPLLRKKRVLLRESVFFSLLRIGREHEEVVYSLC
jgi:hypothetical protein